MSVAVAIEANEQAIGAEPVRARVRFAVQGELVGDTEVALHARRHELRVDEPEALADAVDAHCPVLSLFANPTPVERRLAVPA